MRPLKDNSFAESISLDNAKLELQAKKFRRFIHSLHFDEKTMLI